MIQKIKQDLERRYTLHEHRLDHVLGVAQTAMDLGEREGLDPKKLLIAALLHDITKYEDEKFHQEKIEQYFTDSDDIFKQYSEKLWHTFSAYAYAIEEYHIEDSDILEAILYHAVGAPAMNPYAETIFLSDYIEPNRTYASCVKVRKIAEDSILQAIYEAMNDTIVYQQQEGETIPEIALEARAYYHKKLEELWKN
jgi:predicted HD superfamily hydrolase involved in NAD metabolism